MKRIKRISFQGFKIQNPEPLHNTKARLPQWNPLTDKKKKSKRR